MQTSGIRLKPGHIIHTMLSEHDEILNILTELEKLGEIIYKENDFSRAEQVINNCSLLVEKIIDAEAHHQREEKVIFPELESRGIVDQTKIMRWEHHELRAYKKDLQKKFKSLNSENFQSKKARINFP